MGSKWYVARTEPRAEFLAAKELGRDGYEIFFPRSKAIKPLIAHDDTPLFPGYLFMRCDLEDGNWPVFRPAHRILGWVSFGGEVPSIPDQVVAELEDRVEGISQDGGLWHRYRCGERVQVVSGSLDSLAEVVEEPKSPRARAKVLMHFMGRLVEAQIPWENLRPIQDFEKQIHPLPRRTRGKGRWIRSSGASGVATT